jgi:uncharacterized protein
MDPRASSLIETLGLAAHPEGGFFREVFRADSLVTPSSSAPQRSALTSIYYLLPAGHKSRWHRVASDEVWQFLEGDPLELHILDPTLARLRTHLLGAVSDGVRPVQAVPPLHWQAAVPIGAFTLATCTVGPGFEFADLSLLTDNQLLREKMRQEFPQLASLL